jgi:hypothetical protein
MLPSVMTSGNKSARDFRLEVTFLNQGESDRLADDLVPNRGRACDVCVNRGLWLPGSGVRDLQSRPS